MIRSFEELLEAAKARSGVKVAVAAAEDREVLEAVAIATEQRMGEFILFGDDPKIALSRPRWSWIYRASRS